MVFDKETKERSSGQTPFTVKPKQLALKKKQFLTQRKYFPNLKEKIFTFVSSNFLVYNVKKSFKKLVFAHENMKKQT